MTKRKPGPEPAAITGPYDRLAVYHEELHRGIVHTPEWDARMAKLRARFERDLADRVKEACQDLIYRRCSEIALGTTWDEAGEAVAALLADPEPPVAEAG